MAKAIISNRIYLDDLTDVELKHITETLTYRMEERGFERQKSGKLNSTKKISYLKNYKLLPRGIITIPAGRSDLIPSRHTVVDKRFSEDVPFPKPRFPLRPLQQEIYDDIIDSCFINAKVGFGKTFLALHIASKLGQRTLVICHTSALRDQWIEEAESLYGMEIGKVGGGTFDIEDKAIVVANIQSLKKHLPELSKEFGTVLVDECMDYESTILTKELGPQKIGSIVNSKKPVSVMSVNIETGVAEYKKIVQWFKTPEIKCLKISHSGGGAFKCTPNHNVYTLGLDNTPVKVMAANLKIGDFILQTTSLHKSTHILNKEWLPIMLGLILGDGSLGFAHSKSDSVRLRVTHGVNQVEYLEWKAELLVSSSPTLGSTKSGYCDNEVFNYTTKSFFDHFGLFGALYVDNHKKRIPASISTLLTKESWAIMFQDDGSSSTGSDVVVFSFCELDEESVFNLQYSLEELFGITDSIQFVCQKGYRYLRLNMDATFKFLQGIAHLVHPSMYYKLKRYHKHQDTAFNFPVPNVPIFNTAYAVRRIKNIEEDTLTYGYKYNIEVEDNHNYFANGILVSNCHHVPATTFTEALDSFYARYKIGLSGTMQRKDGKHVLLKDFFTPKVYQPAVDNTIEPVVRILKPGVYLDPKLAWAQKINALLYDEDYQQFIAKLTCKAIDDGHAVLIIASRIEFLQKVKEYVGETCLLVTGETSLEYRKAASAAIDEGTAKAIAGSRQIFSEGISVNRLSAVILAEPMSHDGLVEQIVGRVMRKHENKTTNPVVYDINFSDHPSRKQNESRMAFYIEKGWEIERY